MSRPLGSLDCSLLGYGPSDVACSYAVEGWNLAQDTATAQGMFGFASLTITQAQTLLPPIFMVLATAFVARLIIQLVKG